MLFSTLLTSAVLVHLSIAGYVLEDDYTNDFFGNFDFFTGNDPTNGFVQYVDQSTAQSSNLINSSSSSVYMGVDSINTTPNGRPSVRLTSKKTYDSGLVILDLEHMPTGCGTWPAFWMVGPSWPNSGEIDIIEGVNEQSGNAMTLHTGAGCSISNGGGFSGSITTSNCDVNAADQEKNAGCQITNAASDSYGAGLNSVNGGVYATLWTDSAISIYYFTRSNIPSDISSGAPDPSTWGVPVATFKGSCDIASTFKSQQIVFDTTFCGDWAGNVWSSGSCASKASTCNAFVENNPSAFTDAYWSINSLKVYQSSGSQTSQQIPSQSRSSSAVVISSAVGSTAQASTPISSPSTFAISTKPSAVSTLTTPFIAPTTTPPFPVGNATRPGLSTGSVVTAPFSFSSRNSANVTLPSGSGVSSNSFTQPTVYTTLTLIQTLPNPGNTVVTMPSGAEPTSQPAEITVSALPLSFFPSHEHATGVPAGRAERRRRHLREHKKRHEIV